MKIKKREAGNGPLKTETGAVVVVVKWSGCSLTIRVKNQQTSTVLLKNCLKRKEINLNRGPDCPI